VTTTDTDSSATPAPPAPGELPSSSTLFRSTLIALGVAALILVTVVLPAEYGVDPTGIGRPLGLTRMGEIKVALAREAAEAEAAEAAERATAGAGSAQSAAGATGAAAPASGVTPPAPGSAGAAAREAGSRTDSVSVTLRPGEGAEYKLAMRKDARVNFAWTVAGGVVNYDQHADRPGVRYHGYEKGQATPAAEGVLVAAFDGWHGWFWRNRGTAPVTVTLRTNGDYQEMKRAD
jgi:hypothetical protein